MENIKVNVNIDIATGDPITPKEIIFEYKCLFNNCVLKIPSYNFETILAEKMQTILARFEANSRSKDYYDLYIIYKMKLEEIDKTQIRKAFINTCNHRKTTFSKIVAIEIVNNISKNPNILKRWIAYVKKNKFANGIDFSSIYCVMVDIIEMIF